MVDTIGQERIRESRGRDGREDSAPVPVLAGASPALSTGTPANSDCLRSICSFKLLDSAWHTGLASCKGLAKGGGGSEPGEFPLPAHRRPGSRRGEVRPGRPRQSPQTQDVPKDNESGGHGRVAACLGDRSGFPTEQVG